LQRANALRDRVREISMTFRRQTLGPLSISVGIATLPVHGVDGASLIHAADLALYRAKREGRDRVVIAEQPEASSVAGAETGFS
jgi:diguanylate cyclase (GGDEF)-like protein